MLVFWWTIINGKYYTCMHCSNFNVKSALCLSKGLKVTFILFMHWVNSSLINVFLLLKLSASNWGLMFTLSLPSPEKPLCTEHWLSLCTALHFILQMTSLFHIFLDDYFTHRRRLTGIKYQFDADCVCQHSSSLNTLDILVGHSQFTHWFWSDTT